MHRGGVELSTPPLLCSLRARESGHHQNASQTRKYSVLFPLALRPYPSYPEEKPLNWANCVAWIVNRVFSQGLTSTSSMTPLVLGAPTRLPTTGAGVYSS